MPPDSGASPDQPADLPGLPQVVRLAAYGVIVRDGRLLSADLVERVLAGLEAGG
jgi:hypothetical protein